MAGEPQTTTLHQIPEQTGRGSIDRQVWETQMMTMNPTEAKTYFCAKIVGEIADNTDYPGDVTFGEDFLTPIYTGFSISRSVGNKFQVSRVITALAKMEQWSCDMLEVSKDIRSWLAAKEGEANAAPKLAAIASWEALKDAGDWTHWQAFKYPDPNTAAGVEPTYLNLSALGENTLKLAQKIMKGVESYSIYCPVLTRTTTWNCLPPCGDIGKIDCPEIRSDWFSTSGTEAELAIWLGLAAEWLKTGERASSNGDGTFSFTEQWTGADKIDPDLYPPADPVGGGDDDVE